MPRSAWVVCLAAMTASASAQSAHEQADALFRRGKELMAQKQFAEACTAFARSHELEPNISTLLNHADCREKNAQLATASRLFADAEQQTRAQPDPTSKQLNAVAAARTGKLEARLSKLTIDVASDGRLAGLEILRNTDLVDPGTWSRSLPLDGGTYQITARAPGRADWSTTVVLKPEGDIQSVTVPKLVSVMPAEPRPDVDLPTPAEKAAANPAPASVDPSTHRPVLPPTNNSNTRRSLALPIAMGSATLLLGGAAFAFSRWGDSIYADAQREPDDAKQEALWKSANQRRYAAIGLAAGAAGCLGAAIYFYIRGSRESAQPVARRSIRIEPTASASTMGLGLGGVW